MHLSISCLTPTPGEYRGFDKSSRQMPHPWGEIGCQIPTMSPLLVGDLTADIWLSIVLLKLKTVVSVIPSLCYKIGKNQCQCQMPQGWGQVLMSNPHLRCRDARGGA